MGRSLLVARLWLEVNSFSPLPTTRDDFAAMEWARGAEALAAFQGTPTELGAVCGFRESRPDWRVAVSRCAAASPGGPMDDALFDEFTDELVADLRSEGWDAVYLSLHGSLATGSRTLPELDLLRRVREAIGRTPLGVSFDLHANLDPEIAGLVDFAAGYKTLPHLDMAETAARVLEMLARTAEGSIRPVGHIVRLGRILHSFRMQTTAPGPMTEVEAIARDLTRPPILDVTPFAGFPYADSPMTGASVMAFADGDLDAAERAAEIVAAALRAREPALDVRLPAPDTALRAALALPEGTVAVLESADNTYSGGIGDTPGLLRALLDLLPAVPTVFAYFHDPGLVVRAHAAGIGAFLDGSLGGRVTPAYGDPVAFSARVARLTDGVFVNDGPMFRGVTVRLGPTAVLQIGSVEIIVTSRREPVNDTAYFRLHGIDLAAMRLVCAKGKTHIRASLGGICRAFVEVDTSGPAGIDLTKLPYRHARL